MQEVCDLVHAYHENGDFDEHLLFCDIEILEVWGLVKFFFFYVRVFNQAQDILDRSGYNTSLRTLCSLECVGLATVGWAK